MSLLIARNILQDRNAAISDRAGNLNASHATICDACIVVSTWLYLPIFAKPAVPW